MRSKLQEALDTIQADDALKNQTLNYVLEKAINKPAHKSWKKKSRRLIPAFSTMAAAAIMITGIWLYFTPVSVISIDVNPSVEMNVNRFYRIVDVNAYNSDGQQLADELNLKFKNYEDAVEMLLNTDTIQNLLSKDEILSIVVTGEDNTRNQEILSSIENCTDEQKNTYYYCTDENELEEAHSHGMSYGKYHAYIQLHEYEPSLTPDEACHMTMKEIHDELEDHTSDSSSDSNASKNTSSQGSGHHGEHHHGKHE